MIHWENRSCVDGSLHPHAYPKEIQTINGSFSSSGFTRYRLSNFCRVSLLLIGVPWSSSSSNTRLIVSYRWRETSLDKLVEKKDYWSDFDEESLHVVRFLSIHRGNFSNWKSSMRDFTFNFVHCWWNVSRWFSIDCKS